MEGGGTPQLPITNYYCVEYFITKAKLCYLLWRAQTEHADILEYLKLPGELKLNMQTFWKVNI